MVGKGYVGDVAGGVSGATVKEDLEAVQNVIEGRFAAAGSHRSS